jgi:hypothetical protein
MTLRAGTAIRLRPATRHNLRHRRMFVWVPIGWVERIVDLRLGVLLGAARHLPHDRVIQRLGRRRDRIGPIRIVGGAGHRWPHHECRQNNARKQDYH